MPATVQPSGRTIRSRTRKTTPATATGTATICVSRSTFVTYCSRVSSLAARWRVEEPVHAHPAVACLPDQVRHQQQSGDRDRERETPGAQTSRRQTTNVAIRRTRTTASVYLVSNPTPRRSRAAARSRGRARAAAPARARASSQLVEGDRLEQVVCREHAGRERDRYRREDLRTATAAQLARDQRADHDRGGAGEDREAAEPDKRPAVQHPRQRRDAAPLPAGTRHSRPASAGQRPRSRSCRDASRTGQRTRSRAPLERHHHRHRSKREDNYN